ncbi:hypothetical protein EYC84_001116 [Monilinia fructicola]|uniref:Uncharacterized protein n=1 Tax=Monilinia fructicola TaxID=38448 RepID=A0A5M9JJ22_MONFR|nr:hypothetical protein EYC84_001116 [Monilinia fructicola]
MPTYTPSIPAYQAYNPPKADDQFRRPGNENTYQTRHNSYDSRDLRYNSSYEDMQPTVEDAPPTPAPGPGGYKALPHRASAPSPMQQQTAEMYDQVPAPLNLKNRPSGNSISTSTPSHQYSTSSGGYAPSSSMSSVRDSVTSKNSYGQPHSSRPDRSQSLGMAGANGDYGLPEMPPTLVPGMDPIIAKEISDRIYNEKRAGYSQNAASSQRGRYQQSPRHQPQEIQQPIPLPYHDNSAVVPYSPQGAYDDRQGRYATSTAMVPVKPRGASPNPAMNGRGASPNPPMDRRGASPNPMNRRGASPNPPVARRGVSPNPAVMRKSVSPAPEPRRLSGIAFGPDSYDVFNPSLAGSKSATSLSAAYESKDDADAKIITHDGREIDPSDHIPDRITRLSWNKKDRNTHRKCQTAIIEVPQLRNPYRQMVASLYVKQEDLNQRRGEHRKASKESKSHVCTACISLIPKHSALQRPNYASSRTSIQRPAMAEYGIDNYQQNGYQYGSSPGGGYRGNVGPAVPAKIPMALPAPVSGGGRGGVGDSWALLEEMKSIDLGAPSSRRRRKGIGSDGAGWMDGIARQMKSEWYSMVWYGMVWHGMAWHGMALKMGG